MAVVPYMPFYVADYMADTSHLSTTEHGAYLLLILSYWQSSRPLPSSPDRLANIARMPLSEWEKIHEVIAAFFTENGKLWNHKRIDIEIDKFNAKSESARGSANARYANAMRTQSERRANAERSNSGRGAGKPSHDKPPVPTQSEFDANAERTQSERTINGESLHNSMRTQSERTANAERTHCYTDTDTDTRKKEERTLEKTTGTVASEPQTRADRPALVPLGPFNRWWDVWSGTRGSHHKREAVQAWMSVVNPDNEAACFECTASYLASLDDPARGHNPDNFLFKFAQSQFDDRWPVAGLGRNSSGSDKHQQRRDQVNEGAKMLRKMR